MLHGRVVRPRGQGAYGAGAKVATLDEASIAHIPARAWCARAISSAWWPNANGMRFARLSN